MVTCAATAALQLHVTNVSMPYLHAQVMEDDEHYVDDPKNPQFQHHGGEYAYQGGNSGGDFEGEGFQGEHEGYEASGDASYFHLLQTYSTCNGLRSLISSGLRFGHTACTVNLSAV